MNSIEFIEFIELVPSRRRYPGFPSAWYPRHLIRLIVQQHPSNSTWYDQFILSYRSWRLSVTLFDAFFSTTTSSFPPRVRLKSHNWVNFPSDCLNWANGQGELWNLWHGRSLWRHGRKVHCWRGDTSEHRLLFVIDKFTGQDPWSKAPAKDRESKWQQKGGNISKY